MKIRKLKEVAVLLLVSLSLVLSPVRGLADELTSELLEESEKSKKEAEAEKKKLQSGLTDVKKTIEYLESKKEDISEYVTALDEELSGINLKIEEIQVKIKLKEEEIKTTEAELVGAKETEAHQYEMMKKRVKYAYERGNKSLMEFLFTSSSFADFINASGYMAKLSSYDKKMLDSYVEARIKVEETEARLEEEKVQLEEENEALKNEQDAINVLMDEKEQELSQYDESISAQEAAVKEYQAYIAEQEAMIKEMEAQIIAEKKRLIEENKKTIKYDGGKFCFPAPSYTRVSDDYGSRMHPTLKIEQFHNGLDLAAPSGSPILAAYDGEVTATGYSATMGNYAMIDHGDGLYTIYMHASSISASKGATVVRGEQIGKVGSTGRSTGPHLHFGVRQNGSYVSPWKFISK